MKILWYSDSPTVNTGFGTVARNLITRLLDLRPDIEIDVIGVNEDGIHHDLRRHPRLRIYPAYMSVDVYGRMRIMEALAKESYDHVFMIHDLQTMVTPIAQDGSTVCSGIEEYRKAYPSKTKFHLYFPIDVVFPSDADHSWTKPLQVFDTLIPYTYFAQEQAEKAGLNTVEPMYHGVDTDKVYPMNEGDKKEIKKQMFGISPETKLISIIARNQGRKNIPFAIEAFAKFKEDSNPNSFLYVHSRETDIGGSLKRYFDIWGLKEGRDYLTAGKLDTQRGIHEEQLNYVYNATDLLISAACGEGFGLPYLEAMATKTPIMATNTSVERELLHPAYVYDYAYTLQYVTSGADSLPYPRMYPEDPVAFSEHMKMVLGDYYLQEKKNRAYDEVKKNFDWNKAAKRVSDILI